MIHVDLSNTTSDRSRAACLEEAVGLAHAIDLHVSDAHIVRLARINPSTYIGKGKIEELAQRIAEKTIELVIINCGLSPLQQRNLEKQLACKVIDRTALILEIFGARARTSEGKLQVELASLTYQKSRLVRSWTHLERQRGGFGFLGGPGESQIEIDRRLIGERIDKIKLSLERVLRTRTLHRNKRRDNPIPTVALVGYTNAGKSTLFNRLTKSHVIAKDQLFATLDPTVRALVLPSGLSIRLSDTVGFISNLPTELVASFRATLEEVLEADVLIHVRDGSHTDSDAQKKDVLTVLQQLFGSRDIMVPIIEILNKCDQEEASIEPCDALRISAQSGLHCDQLLLLIEEALSAYMLETHHIQLPASNGKALAWLYAHGSVAKDIIRKETHTITVRLSAADAARYYAMFEKN